ncbi:MAG: hypothetical protein JSU94_14595 [Phycisphaerales bacterium]|nr:MAG: hypothetical protein JSU94_14595 [Phycisphaerales bacterium]
MAKKKSKRTIVGVPLTPSLLAELGAAGRFCPAPKDFRPGGGVQQYRIWTCHGYRESGNQSVGFLRIDRAADDREGSFALRVDRKVSQTDGLVHTTTATIRCLRDQTASPIEWRLSSLFTGPGGEVRPELGAVESGKISGGVMTVTRGIRKLTRNVSDKLTCNWCLFEAVQRLGFEARRELVFDLLEGLSLLKTGQRLSYAGSEQAGLGGRRVRLHRFTQIGRGVLPTDYWLDEAHRVLFVCSMNKAYILDDSAQKVVERNIRKL